MSNVSVNAAIERVSLLLQDVTNIRWPQDELLKFVSDGQREIALLKPDVCISISSLPLVSGTRQSIPSNGVSLIEITRNIPGNAIRVVSREILDAQIPNWHGASPTAAVVHYTFNPSNQKGFFVYPPNNGSGVVEIVYNVSPAELTLGSTLQIDEVWLPSIVNYALYRAYSKDAEYAQNANLAVAYYQAFVASLTGRSGAEASIQSNAITAPFNPNVPKR